jgi:quinol-cytochrome oxidoreductase complex cytochrome b subunit
VGGVARSLHRYASDAMVITVLLHLAREFVLDRYRGVRWYAWLTGAILLWFLYASGIGGYWLVWDRLAQYIAVATTEWLDWLPIFAEPIARNFLNSASVNDRFFSLLVFMHIIPLFLLLGMDSFCASAAQKPSTAPDRDRYLGACGVVAGLSGAQPGAGRHAAGCSRLVLPPCIP